MAGFDRLDEAIWMATEAHHGQYDKAGYPYILHPMRVMDDLRPYEDQDVLCAAVLHDTVEDTYVTLAKIENDFGLKVRLLVDAVSRRDGETYEDFILRVRSSGQDAISIKVADINDNMRPDRYLNSSLTERYEKAKETLLWDEE